MGTRADFYVGKGLEAEWIGSIAWDGYRDGIDKAIIRSTSENDYRSSVARFFIDRDDVTLPARGWPWPWPTSATTDCSYWFFDGQVWDENDDCYFPCSLDPEEDNNVVREQIDYPEFELIVSAEAGSARSGIIVVGKR